MNPSHHLEKENCDERSDLPHRARRRDRGHSFLLWLAMSARVIAFESFSLRPSFETPALGGLLRMRTEAWLRFKEAPMLISLILRRRVSAVSKDEACASAVATSHCDSPAMSMTVPHPDAPKPVKSFAIWRAPND